MRKTIFISMLVTVSTLLAACGSAPTLAATASSSAVNIEVETHPDPAAMGDLELVFSVTDANGQPIEGVTVDVSAEHTNMSGMDMSGLATDQVAEGIPSSPTSA